MKYSPLIPTAMQITSCKKQQCYRNTFITPLQPLIGTGDETILTYLMTHKILKCITCSRRTHVGVNVLRKLMHKQKHFATE